jgi:hypothetical protein
MNINNGFRDEHHKIERNAFCQNPGKRKDKQPIKAGKHFFLLTSVGKKYYILTSIYF